MHVMTSSSREDRLYECNRTGDSVSCVFFTALWPQQNRSLLVQEIRPATNIDMTCFKRVLVNSTTCLHVGPTYLDWPVDPIAGHEHPGPSRSHEEPNDKLQGGAAPAPMHCRRKRDALQPPQILHGTAVRDTCGHLPDVGLVMYFLEH